MVSKEVQQPLVLPDRLASRKALTVFEELKQIPGLSEEQYFGGFLLSDEQEKEVGASVSNQLNLLVKSLHEGLTETEALEASPEAAIRHLDANVFVLSAFTGEKLTAQAVCLMGKNQRQSRITRLDSFFYYNNQGEEGIIETRTYYPFNGNNRQEFLYDGQIEQKRLLRAEERQLNSGFFLLKHPEGTGLHRQSWDQVNGYKAFSRSSYQQGLEIIREVAYITPDSSSQLGYYVSFEESPTEGTLVVKRLEQSQQREERWVARVSEYVRMDYTHLLMARGEPDWDGELELSFKMVIDQGHLSAVVDGEVWHGEEEGEALPPAEKVLIFKNQAGTQRLKVGLDPDGNIEEFAFEEGLSSLADRLN